MVKTFWKARGKVWYVPNSDKKLGRYVPTSMLKKDSDEYKTRREEFAEQQAEKVMKEIAANSEHMNKMRSKLAGHKFTKEEIIGYD